MKRSINIRKEGTCQNILYQQLQSEQRELKKIQEEGNKDNSNFIKSNKQHGVIPLAVSFTSLILFTYIEKKKQKNCWKVILKHLHIDEIFLKESLGMRLLLENNILHTLHLFLTSFCFHFIFCPSGLHSLYFFSFCSAHFDRVVVDFLLDFRLIFQN